MTNKNLLHDYMDLLRNRDYSECGYSLYNIIKTMKLSRKNIICGENFDNLDFGLIPLNEIDFSQDGTNPSSFRNVKLEETSFISGHSDEIDSVAFSPDGKYCITGSSEETIFWDMYSGLVHKKINMGAYEIEVSPCEKYIFILSGRRVLLLDAITYEVHKELKVYAGYSAKAVFSHNGRYYIIASKDKTVVLWEVETNSPYRIFEKHTEDIWSIAVSPNGRYCLTGSDDQTAILWDIETGKPFWVSKKYPANISSVKFSPCGTYFLVAAYGKGANGVIELLSNKRNGWSFNHDFCAETAFSPDERYCLTWKERIVDEVTEEIVLWDIKTGEPHAVLGYTEDNIFGFSFSPDGKYLLTGSITKNTPTLWNVETGEIVKEFIGHNSPASFVKFSPDGKFCFASAGNTAIIWDVETGHLRRKFDGYTGSISAYLSPNEKHCLTLSCDGTGILWDLSMGKVHKKLLSNVGWHFYDPNLMPYHSASFSPDGKYCAIAYKDDKDAIIWNVITGDIHKILTGYNRGIMSVAFSPNGKYCITGGLGEAIIWNVETGDVYKKLSKLSSWVSKVIFSSCSKYCITYNDTYSDGTKVIKGKYIIWNVTTGKRTKNTNIDVIDPENSQKKLFSENEPRKGVFTVECTNGKLDTLYHIHNINIVNCDFSGVHATDAVKKILYQNNTINVENPPLSEQELKKYGKQKSAP